ncbi:hypothetical protein NDU88_007192 [Pleurodeles waltl]|uniref:Uncharacterized protein n=1 Tax=Pleurodeles waltl TaxID=8319 RepID=A0AAV7N582_PLEWA|nr:hypothetical protein NDU88_007192 [Pleurodeles waltl]
MAVTASRDLTVGFTQLAWKKIAARAGSNLLYSPDMPLLGHKVISMTCEAAGVKLLTKLHILKWGDLYTDSRLLEQDVFSHDGLQSPLETFLYLRLKRSIKGLAPSFPSEPHNLNTFHALLQLSSLRHLVSILYHSIQQEQPITGDGRTRVGRKNCRYNYRRHNGRTAVSRLGELLQAVD